MVGCRISQFIVAHNQTDSTIHNILEFTKPVTFDQGNGYLDNHFVFSVDQNALGNYSIDTGPGTGEGGLRWEERKISKGIMGNYALKSVDGCPCKHMLLAR